MNSSKYITMVPFCGDTLIRRCDECNQYIPKDPDGARCRGHGKEFCSLACKLKYEAKQEKKREDAEGTV
jgi:hypothetical protein